MSGSIPRRRERSPAPWGPTPAHQAEAALRWAGGLPEGGAMVLAGSLADPDTKPVRRRADPLPAAPSGPLLPDPSPWPGVGAKAWLLLPGASPVDAPVPPSPLPGLVAALLARAPEACSGTRADLVRAVLDLHLEAVEAGPPRILSSALTIEAYAPKGRSRRGARAQVGLLHLDGEVAMAMAQALVGASPWWFDRMRRLVMVAGVPYDIAPA